MMAIVGLRVCGAGNDFVEQLVVGSVVVMVMMLTKVFRLVLVESNGTVSN